MNKDQVEGKTDQVAGKIKQKVGEAVGNDNLANRGVADQVKGAAKETWGNVKDAANQNA
ncbi:MAG: CsbD family protein, partial [Acidobacteriaceae bacterium]